MPKQHHILLLAGQNGSKSTFIGALYKHINDEEAMNVTYTPVEGNISDEFEDGVLSAMMTRGEYPDQTEEPYVVRLEIGGGSSIVPNIAFDFIDVPGEEIDNVLEPVLDDIKAGAIDYDDVAREFESNIEPKIGSNQSITLDDWKTIFKHYYGQATKVIFLMNVHKIGIIGKDPTFDTEVLTRTADEKVETALISTAVDIIGYDPDDADFSTSLRPGPQMIDHGLLEHMNDKIGLGDSPGAVNILNRMKQTSKIDSFGVSVPAETPGSDNLDRSSGSFDTRGFDEVVEWLKK